MTWRLSLLRWATRRAPTTQKYLSRNRAIVGPDGRIGVYRKVHLWGAENLFFEPGDLGIGVWKTMFGRMSVAICYDGWSCAAQCRRGTFLADQVRRIDRSRKFVRRNPVWRSRAARLQQSLTICRSDPGRREAVRNKSIGRRNSCVDSHRPGTVYSSSLRLRGSQPSMRAWALDLRRTRVMAQAKNIQGTKSRA